MMPGKLGSTGFVIECFEAIHSSLLLFLLLCNIDAGVAKSE
jgi:hypothetical protein